MKKLSLVLLTIACFGIGMAYAANKPDMIGGVDDNVVAKTDQQPANAPSTDMTDQADKPAAPGANAPATDAMN